MSWFWDLNLIHCLDIYLVLIFVVGAGLRVLQYRAFLGLILSMHDRWPKLLVLVKQHRGLFLTWATIVPALLALLLAAAHMLACRLVWPQVDVTMGQLEERWALMLVVGFLAAAMIGFDCYGAWQIEKWDRTQTVQQLDQAEHWLQSWTAPVVRVFTLGFVNPRKLVGVEVHQSLVNASRQLNNVLWWSSLPIGLRIAAGGSLWLTYVSGNY